MIQFDLASDPMRPFAHGLRPDRQRRRTGGRRHRMGCGELAGLETG